MLNFFTRSFFGFVFFFNRNVSASQPRSKTLVGVAWEAGGNASEWSFDGWMYSHRNSDQLDLNSTGLNSTGSKLRI